MDQNEFHTKMMELLDGTTTYEKLDWDPTNRMQNLSNNLIASWIKRQYIDLQTGKDLKRYNSLPPKIYGQSKTHKDNCPLRPVVSCIQSPFYNLAKFLANILNKIAFKTNTHIKDSWHFKDFISKVTLLDNYTLVSLDVVSLYTNTPIDVATQILRNRWPEISRYTSIPMENFI